MCDIENILVKEKFFNKLISDVVYRECCDNDLKVTMALIDSVDYPTYIKELLEDYLVDHNLDNDLMVIHYLTVYKIY